jgi:hypothetical protein
MDGSGMLTLTFEELKGILGFEPDHSFLTYKKEAALFGYQVSKISMKKKYITFNKLGFESHLMYCRLPW